jgi:SAM-dependent methyltransferase
MSKQNKFAETEFWDKVSKQRVYAAFDDEEYNSVIDTVWGKDMTGITIADIGSASGVSAALFAARGAKVIGIEIAPDLVAQAKDLWKEYSDRISFEVGDAESLDIPDSSIDAVFFGGVLHHIPLLDKVYAEAYRVLKPGGKFIAIEPNRLDIFERMEWCVADLRGKLTPNEYPINPLDMRRELMESKFISPQFWTIRHDIPVLAQIPLLKLMFNRKKGYWLKKHLLRFFNAFRDPTRRGTFIVMVAER